jgi:hypothetical protein
MQRGAALTCLAGVLERTSVRSFTRSGLTAYTTVTRPDYISFGAGSKSAQCAAFNAFSVLAYIATTTWVTALVHLMSTQQRRADWIYWQLYNTRVERMAYAERFGHAVEQHFGSLQRILSALGYFERDEASYAITERGAIWIHRIQSLFSLNRIDTVWSKCRDMP